MLWVSTPSFLSLVSLFSLDNKLNWLIFDLFLAPHLTMSNLKNSQCLKMRDAKLWEHKIRTSINLNTSNGKLCMREIHVLLLLLPPLHRLDRALIKLYDVWKCAIENFHKFLFSVSFYKNGKSFFFVTLLVWK